MNSELKDPTPTGPPQESSRDSDTQVHDGKDPTQLRAETAKAVSTLESKEVVTPVPITFLKLGGTWDMGEEDGKRIGKGNLDDDEFKALQVEVGLFESRDRNHRKAASLRLVRILDEKFRNTEPIGTVENHLDWCKIKKKAFGDFARGPFIPLFSGDSSHLKPYVTAPMIVHILNTLKNNPTVPIEAGQGTDSADITIPSSIDVYTFDTELAPFLEAGANHPHWQAGSDAPRNFLDMAKLAGVDLKSGAYWIFAGNMYTGADVVKFDPSENRAEMEGQSTFWAPHRSASRIADILKSPRSADLSKRKAPPTEHVINALTVEKLFEAYEGVYVVDLGNQNPAWQDAERIFDSDTKAIVVAGHGLGNVDNEIRSDLVEAAKLGKLIVSVSRAPISQTSKAYAASLVTANDNSAELRDSGARIVVGHRLGKAIARALLTRALIAGLDQNETQELFDEYAAARDMLIVTKEDEE